MLGENRDFSSLDLYTYCGNNPIARADREGMFWDYVLDIGFVVWGIASVIEDPNDWKNWVALGVDVAFAVIPFVPSGVGQIIKAGNKVDKAIDVAKTVNKIGDLQNAEKVTMIGRNMKRVTETAKIIGKADNLYNVWEGYDTVASVSKLLANAISVVHNGSWLFGKLRQGYTVIDIGLSTSHATRGLWYGVESLVLGLWQTRNLWKIPINFCE